jgi:transcription antitermination factor NusG
MEMARTKLNYSLLRDRSAAKPLFPLLAGRKISLVEVCVPKPLPARGSFLMSAWLVARVMTNVEDAVVNRLSRIGTESYWPRFCETIVDRRTHRKRTIIRPLYPCYLFVRSRIFYFLYEIEGITGVVMKGDRPASSDRLDEEITKMQRSENEGLVPAPIIEQSPRLVVGSRVVILSGILRGHVGTCREFRGNRAQVVTNLFGGETPVWHSEQDLAAA